MAVDWLDISRYSDSFGFQVDRERAMWQWRDWVIRSFNENKPFDQFVVEQIAGDMLPNPTKDQILATAFNGYINKKAKEDPSRKSIEWNMSRTVFKRTLPHFWG